MAQSSNYKGYNRQTRALTEETSFSGGMMWTGNNVDETHLKTIVNFNYDDTTGFLKTRNPIKPLRVGDKPLQFFEEIKNDLGTTTISITEAVEGLHDKRLIGAYNICYTDTTDPDNPDVLSRAGWLYLFGDVSNESGYFTCDEDTLVWLYLDSDEHWHTVHADPEMFNGQLLGTTGVKPILYDNTLYCTNADDTQAFYVYRLFKVSREQDNYTVNEYHVYKQSYDEDSTTAFEGTAKELIDSVTLLEATVTGFNGLRGSEMYTYNSTGTESSDARKRIVGAYFKDSAGNLCITPRLGQIVKLHVVLDNVPTASAGSIVLSKLVQGTVEEANAVWEILETKATSLDTVFECTITEEEGTYNIVWLSGTGDDAVRYDGMLVNCSTNKLNTLLRLKPYNLPTAKGSCLWNTHLVLWDVEGAANSLFISETENFYYMPVPNNVAMFETDIISCIPYMGDLLVFTADRVYRLVESNEGTFSQEVVQNNMPLAREEAAYVRAIKNMIFFKSGNYYYMIVPKAQSLTGELSVAPIYKNLAGWFDDPNKATKEILTQLYPENQYRAPESVQTNSMVRKYTPGWMGPIIEDIVEDFATPEDVTVSAPTDIYVEQDTVSILYDVEAWYTTTQSLAEPVHGQTQQVTEYRMQSFVLFVNYNTNLRAWTLYLEDTTEQKLYPAALTAARTMSFVRVTRDGRMYLSTMQESTDVADGVRCLIDTGYRTLSNALKKRFREVQLKLYNPTENITTFGSAFFVDGSIRRNYTHLEEVLMAGDTGYISLAPVYDPNTFLIESTMPITDLGDTVVNTALQGSDSIELSDWALDFSHFKRGAPSTVRIPVSGKGYAPRFVFMSPKCVALHLNEINWVYRIMNGR